MKPSEGSVSNHSRKRALRSPEVGALKIPAVKGSREAMSKGLEEVTVQTLKARYTHWAYRPKRQHLSSQVSPSGVKQLFSPLFERERRMACFQSQSSRNYPHQNLLYIYLCFLFNFFILDWL
jgi:hypothetical protein